MILLAVVVLILVAALGIGIYLSQKPQDIRQQADVGQCGQVQVMDAPGFTPIDTTGDLNTELYRPERKPGRRIVGMVLIGDDEGNRFEIQPVIHTTDGETSEFSSSDCPKTTNPGSNGWYDMCNSNSSYTYVLPNFQQAANREKSILSARFKIHFYDAESGGTRRAHLKALRWRYIDECAGETPPPADLECNSICTTDAQCEEVNPDYGCETVNTNKRCRLKANPSSNTCAAAPADLTCNSPCTTNEQCTEVNAAFTCADVDGAKHCRLATNTSSTSCAAAPTFSCNSTCTTDAECVTANANFKCADINGAKHCRLGTNTGSATCEAAQTVTYSCNSTCNTDDECKTADDDFKCVDVSGTKRCRLGTNNGSDSCQEATTTVAVGCNDTCVTNSDCSNSSHICYQDRCRLETNPSSTACAAAPTTTTTTQVTQTETQPELPAELPQTGPEDWGTWLKVGLGALGVGAVLLLLL
jgi:hypothetical protein